MIVRWKTKNKKVKKLVVVPENDKDEQILTMLMENFINLRDHLLLATKETPSRKIRLTGQKERKDGEVWTTQEHY